MVAELVITAVEEAARIKTRHGKCDKCGKTAELQLVNCTKKLPWLNSWLLEIARTIDREGWHWLCRDCAGQERWSRRRRYPFPIIGRS